jgi:hypothetical protein
MVRQRLKPVVQLQTRENVRASQDERIIRVSGPNPGDATMLLSIRFGGSALVVEPYQLKGDAQVMEPTRVDGRKAELMVSMRGTDQGFEDGEAV